MWTKVDVVQTYPLEAGVELMQTLGGCSYGRTNGARTAKRTHLLVAGGEGKNQRRSAAENVVLPGGVEWIGPGAVVEEHRGIQ